jgi:hypothetical protein
MVQKKVTRFRVKIQTALLSFKIGGPTGTWETMVLNADCSSTLEFGLLTVTFFVEAFLFFCSKEDPYKIPLLLFIPFQIEKVQALILIGGKRKQRIQRNSIDGET